MVQYHKHTVNVKKIGTLVACKKEGLDGGGGSGIHYSLKI